MSHPTPFGHTGLSIIGLGSQYPEGVYTSQDMEELVNRYYEKTPSINKFLGINRKTGIKTRRVVADKNHRLVNMDRAAHMGEIHDAYMNEAVPLATAACREAIAESGLDLSEITHIVASTCTNTSNPSFEHWVMRQLGIQQNVERVCLSGVGCSGSLAALRTAANIAMGHSARHKPARILCITMEICSLLARGELDALAKDDQTRIAACIFGDGASACIVSNGVGNQAEPIYDLVGWHFHMIPDSDEELAFKGDRDGWEVVLTPAVAKLTVAAVPPQFDEFRKMLPSLPSEYREPADFDFAIHPGGSAILEGLQRSLKTTRQHNRASWEHYVNMGNTSGATVFSVLNILRSPEMDAQAPGGRPKEYVFAAAFGPGITVEMSMLKRNLTYKGRAAGATGVETPPSSNGDEDREDQSRLHRLGHLGGAVDTLVLD